jgi:hypothetical protein
MPGYHAGRPPRNKGMRYPADPLEAVDVKEHGAVATHTVDGQAQPTDVGAAVSGDQLGIARQASDQVHAVHRVLLRPRGAVW